MDVGVWKRGAGCRIIVADGDAGAGRRRGLRGSSQNGRRSFASAAAGPARQARRALGLRGDLPHPPPGALPLLPGDPPRPRRRRGRAAGDDGGGAAIAARREPADRGPAVAVPGRSQRVDLDPPSPPRRSRRGRARRSGRAATRCRDRNARAAAEPRRRPRRAAGAAAFGDRHARAERSLLRRDRDGALLYRGGRPAGRLRGANGAPRPRGGARDGM